MFRKGLIALLLLGLIFGLLSACTKSENTSGNTSGNLNNNGIHAQQGDWIYYSNVSSDYHISKMKVDGTQVTDLTKDPGFCINVVGDWVYYSSSKSINRMKTDGSQNTQLTSFSELAFPLYIIQNDMIYFANWDDGRFMYSMKSDGKDPKKLTETPVLRILSDGQWLYYVLEGAPNESGMPAYELHRMKFNGQDDTILATNAGNSIIIDGEWIYYVALAEGNKLYRIKTNGQEKSIISDSSIISLNIANNKIYYSTDSDFPLMVMDLDGSNVTKLLEDSGYSISIMNDWLYFSSRKYMGRLYKAKLDGTALQKAYTLKMVSPDPTGTAVTKGIGRHNLSTFTGSTIVRSGDWIYYSHYGEKSVIRKKQLGTTDKTDILTTDSSYLNTVGDWIYFIDLQSTYSLARIKQDGTEYGIILDKPCAELLVKDNWMIFTDMSEKRQLFKIKTDGTDLTKLSDKSATNLNLVGDSIIYTPYDESKLSSGIYKTNLDGSGTKMISNAKADMLLADVNYVFYSSQSEDWTTNVRRIKLDGTGDITLLSGAPTIFGIKDGWLYYNDGDNDAGLKRISIDGKKIQNVMTPGNFAFFHFIGDKIIVFSNNLNAYYTMNLDGSDQHIWMP